MNHMDDEMNDPRWENPDWPTGQPSYAATGRVATYAQPDTKAST